MLYPTSVDIYKHKFIEMLLNKGCGVGTVIAHEIYCYHKYFMEVKKAQVYALII